MRLILGNRLLDAPGGTEVHLLTLGEHLQRLGHEVVVYSPVLGRFSEHMRTRGVTTTDKLAELPETCDVVFSQDTLVVYDLAQRFPDAFHVFRVCGETFDFQLPPQLAGIIDLIVVLSDRYARPLEACSVKTPVLRLRVPIDANRLLPVEPLREVPRRALLLGNYPERDEVVTEAWGAHGVEVSRIGFLPEAQRLDLTTALAGVDIVVAKSRAVLDAMACGRAVYVFDVFGGDGWVTPDSYQALEADNFTGQATDRVIGVAELERDLALYSHRMGPVNRDLIEQRHNARDHVVEFLAAVGRIATRERPAAPLGELARLTAVQWGWEERFHAAQRATVVLTADAVNAEARAEAAQGRAEAEQARAEAAERLLGEVTSAAAATEERLQAVLRTRAWRTVTRCWRARDRLLGALSLQPRLTAQPDPAFQEEPGSSAIAHELMQ